VCLWLCTENENKRNTDTNYQFAVMTPPPTERRNVLNTESEEDNEAQKLVKYLKNIFGLFE
jgi:hypothetical protein